MEIEYRRRRRYISLVPNPSDPWRRQTEKIWTGMMSLAHHVPLRDHANMLEIAARTGYRLILQVKRRRQNDTGEVTASSRIAGTEMATAAATPWKSTEMGIRTLSLSHRPDLMRRQRQSLRRQRLVWMRAHLRNMMRRHMRKRMHKFLHKHKRP